VPFPKAAAAVVELDGVDEDEGMVEEPVVWDADGLDCSALGSEAVAVEEEDDWDVVWLAVAVVVDKEDCSVVDDFVVAADADVEEEEEVVAAADPVPTVKTSPRA
jgi:hypothetical protein